MREYLLSVVTAAILCGILLEMVGSKSTSTAVLRLLTGIFLAVVIIKPLLQLDLKRHILDADQLREQAEALVASGELQAHEEMKTRIITSVQEYIVQKGNQLGVSVEPEIDLEGYIPSSVRIKGNVSPYIRTSLSAWIEDTLGIPKEEQMWIGVQ